VASSKEEELSRWKAALGPDNMVEAPEELLAKFATLQADLLQHVKQLAEVQTALRFSQGVPRLEVFTSLNTPNIQNKSEGPALIGSWSS
jgi:hypothetical protein